MQAIEDISNVMELLTQHNKLNIRVMSDGIGNIPDEIIARISQPHRKLHHFFLFVKKGSFTHRADLQDMAVNSKQALFILPNQIHQLPRRNPGMQYYKLCFDDSCMALLPRAFPFLVNPYNKQVIDFDDAACKRICAIFDSLAELLQVRDANTTLIGAHLNTLLTEFDHAYFQNTPPVASVTNGLTTYIAFKQLIEDTFLDQPTIEDLAAKLNITANSLYTLVKKYAGHSPKEYITHRLVLEAQRRLYYSETTVKNLAYDLGFTDPDYFSRLFKKSTGKSITQFQESIQETSGI